MEAVAEEVVEEDPFADLFAEGEAEAVEVAVPEVEEAIEETAAVEEVFAAEEAADAEAAVAEAETAVADDAAFATVEEGEAAATLIRKAKKGKGKGKGKDRDSGDREIQDAARVRPVEPAVKPQKKDKFSSEARTPLKPKTAVPAWDSPVMMDGSEAEAPAAAQPSAKPAARESRGAWDEPVLW